MNRYLSSPSMGGYLLRNPLLVAALSFGFWLFSGVESIQYALCGALAILTLKNPLNGMLFLIANETYLGSATPILVGVSLTQIVGGLVIIACLKTKRGFGTFFNWISFLVMAITLVYSISYRSYFGTFDLSILNNMVFFFLLLWAVDLRSKNALLQIALTLLLTNLLLFIISIGYLISNPDDLRGGPFGNARQIGFFGILLIPYLYVLLGSLRESKWWRRLIYLLLFMVVTYNVVTEGRLNLAIIFICLLVLCMKVFSRPLLPKKLLLAVVVASVTFLLSPQMVDKYMSRGMVGARSIDDIMTLDKSGMAMFTSGRSLFYSSALDMFYDFPLLGGGYKRWNHISNEYNPYVTHKASEKLSMHSTHLQYLVETGVVGLALYWLLLGSVAYFSWRTLLKRRNWPEDPRYLCGCIGLFVSLIMFLGGTFDNHGILYRQLFLAAAAVAAITPSYHFGVCRSQIATGKEEVR